MKEETKASGFSSGSWSEGADHPHLCSADLYGTRKKSLKSGKRTWSRIS